MLLEAWNRGVELAWQARKLWLKNRENIRVKLKVVWGGKKLFIKIDGTFSCMFNLGICPRKPTQKFLGKVERAFLNGFMSVWSARDPPIPLYT
ncbi:MAG: hypothetical protein DRJ44_08670 [Thermoprotei archaeon]|nr:MAG: hypothetical protein DRJ44_08670 [Thermoprotei archaeon]